LKQFRSTCICFQSGPIAENGKYQKKYISSFFGYANDYRGKKYTIGVTVREPVAFGTHWYYRYASHSAVPVFREAAKILIKLGYLEIEKKQ